MEPLRDATTSRDLRRLSRSLTSQFDRRRGRTRRRDQPGELRSTCGLT